MFLKKVRLSLKASLSRADILIHEYEESVATVLKRLVLISIEYLKTKIHGDRQYFLNANAI